MSTINFSPLKSVNNPSSIHGIYPYRGKISSLEAKLVCEQLPLKSTLLDPFCGTGTIPFEGVCNHLHVIGIDNNPLAIAISRGKINSLEKHSSYFENEAIEIVSKAKDNKNYCDMPENALHHFHPETAIEIMQVFSFFDEMSDYLKAVFFGAIALAARGCNHYKWTSTTVGKDINPKNFISFFEKFLAKAKKHHPNKTLDDLEVGLFQADSRCLSTIIPLNSVDFVFTSPPYFDALDYTAYYGRIIYSILGADRNIIRDGLIQDVRTYEKDMKLVLDEVIKVTKDDAQICFVVGDKKVGKGVINGGEFFSTLLHHKPNQIIEREYTQTSSQVFDKLNKTSRKEQIVIWNKATW